MMYVQPEPMLESAGWLSNGLLPCPNPYGILDLAVETQTQMRTFKYILLRVQPVSPQLLRLATNANHTERDNLS